MSEHDQRFKVLLREYFPEFVGLFFPPWAARLDFAGLEGLDKELFSNPPRGERRELDFLARTPATVTPTTVPGDQKGPWPVLLHLEVESADSVATLHGRMFDYSCPLRMNQELPVLSVGVYPRVGFDGVGWSHYVKSVWGREQMRFEYARVGLPALDAFDYLNREGVLGAALAVLMRVPPGRRAELKAAAEQRVAAGAENAYRKHLLGECIDAYAVLEGAEWEEYNRLLETEPYAEARTLTRTRYEEAMETGIERGQLGLLLRLVERRFGPLGEDARRRVELLPAERLGEFGEALLAATSLRDLGLADE